MGIGPRTGTSFEPWLTWPLSCQPNQPQSPKYPLVKRETVGCVVGRSSAISRKHRINTTVNSTVDFIATKLVLKPACDANSMVLLVSRESPLH